MALTQEMIEGAAVSPQVAAYLRHVRLNAEYLNRDRFSDFRAAAIARNPHVYPYEAYLGHEVGPQPKRAIVKPRSEFMSKRVAHRWSP